MKRKTKDMNETDAANDMSATHDMNESNAMNEMKMNRHEMT